MPTVINLATRMAKRWGLHSATQRGLRLPTAINSATRMAKRWDSLTARRMVTEKPKAKD